jgi:hypothetical protein
MQISNLEPLTYGMTINTNSTFNLKQLSLDFPLDKNLPGFVSKSYFTKDFGYSFPAKGPIPKFFKCLYCKNVGTDYHNINCEKPLDSSLILNETTDDYPGAKRGASYDLIVVKSGQKKAATKGINRRDELVYDCLDLRYKYVNENESVIRIYGNGNINLTAVPFTNEEFPEIIAGKVKINTEFIKKKYLLLAQFNIFPKTQKENTMVNLNVLNINLTLPYFKIKQGPVEYFKADDDYYIVEKYNYNSGENYSRSGKITNPYILFVLIDPENKSIKTTVQIYRRGAIQLKSSYANKKNPEGSLELPVLTKVYVFLKKLINNINEQSNNNLLVSEVILKKPKINNLVDGKQPQKCQNRKGTNPGEGDKRPIPYSFYGTCPIPGQYVPPRGTLRSDGKYEPCCMELKETGKDSKKRFKNIILNGYPDAEASTFDEPTPVYGDSAVYAPGTKIVESRSFPGLNQLSKEQLISYLNDYGYINEYALFNKKGKRVQFRKLQALTLNTFSKLSKYSYVISPIYNNTINCLLSIDQSGKSYFLNKSGEISETGVGDFPELAGTVIDCYVLPFENPQVYFIDIKSLKNEDVTKKEFYSQESKNTRFNDLKYCFDLLKTNSVININLNLDLNIIGGAQYYTTRENVTGLLFIPYKDGYYSVNTMIWSDTEHEYNNTISLNVKHLNKNRWVVSYNGQNINQTLLPQGDNNDIEIPVSFVSKNNINNGDIVLFRINIKQTDFVIENRKPLTALEKLDAHINDFSDVISVLQSIQTPIPISLFQNINVNPPGFILGNQLYYQTQITEPLKVSTITTVL